MKQSFRHRITIFLLGTIALTIIMCWFLNLTFLKRYYAYTKVTLMREVYSAVNDYVGAVNGDALSQEQKGRLERIEAAENVKIYLFQDVELDTDFGMIYFTYFVYPEQVILPHNEREQQGGMSAAMMENREYYRIYESAQEYMFPNLFKETISQVEAVELTNEYMIMTQHNNAMDSDFMDLFGDTEFGYNVFVRSAQESIEEAVDISNRFLFLLGCCVMAIAAFVSYLFSRRFTRPVLELAKIASKMSELDFETKYEVDGEDEDEIAVLGNSINSLSEKLEHTISELKAANIELQNDIERKTQIDEVRKEFLSNVTHELKTPIALIQGYAEGLKDNINDDPENRDFYCEVIIDEATKMNKMVKKLLSLNQLEVGTAQPEIERFDIVPLVRSVLGSTEILFQQKQVALRLDTDESVYVWADEYMMEEVFTNFISNALNHVGGRLQIDVSLRHEGEKVRLSVFNTGEPIPEEALSQVWVKFYKVDKARTREYGGSGIGLSIVKAIMELHRQNYGVRNVTDGVEFWIELDGGENLEKYSRNFENQ